MAIDRGFLAGWVDDDGSDTVGTVWNKARIHDTLNPIDVCFGEWTGWPEIVFGTTTAGSFWTVPNVNFRFRVSNHRTILVRFAFESTSIAGVAAASLYCTLPFLARAWGGPPASTMAYSFGATGHEPILAEISVDRGKLEFKRMGTGTFPVISGALYIRGQLTYETD